MKILITGLGSIGQRHYKNLVSLGYKVAVYRSGKKNSPHQEKFLQEQLDLGNKVEEFFDLKDALEVVDPTVVFVTNPNSKHIDIALQAAKAKKHLFIEKPLSYNLQGLEELSKITEEHNLKVMIGYNLRWHPLLAKMKTLLSEGAIGKPLAASIEMGEYIVDWHPWEDYLDSYAPYKDDGGGAVLCFSHDLDYLYWFFGLPKKIYAVGGKITPLGGDAEDMVKAICSYDGLIVDIHLDYWQRPKKRIFEIIGTQGTLLWNYDTGVLQMTSRDEVGRSENYYVPGSFERNDMFIEEVKSFISAIESRVDSPIGLKQGTDVLTFALMIKDSIGFNSTTEHN